jgi:hypothetical protein
MLLKILERCLHVANWLLPELVRMPSVVLVIRRRKTKVNVVPIGKRLQEFPGLVF